MGKNKFKNYDQGDFYSAYFYSYMPNNKFLDNVDKIIDFKIFNNIFDHFYSDIGQKAFSPAMQVKVIFLQTNYALSDRQLEERLNFDLSWKKFVGLPAGFFGYDHSTLGLFRDRIGVDGYKAIHNYILAQIVDRGLVDVGEPWLKVQLTLCQNNEIFKDPEVGEAKGTKHVKITRYREKTKEEKPGDRIVSAVDEDARRGAKSAKKFFLGPKSEITLTGKSHLILNAKGIAGNEPDGGHIFEMVDEVKEIHGIEPPKIIGDGKYGSIDTRIEGKERGIQVVAPLADPVNPTGGYTADKFKYDPLLSIVICPAGRLTSMNHRNEAAGATVYHFSATVCSVCPQKAQCTKSDHGRTITIEDTWAITEDARRYLGTPEGRQDMRLRSQLERVNDELKNNLGLKVSRFYGLAKHQIQLHATSFVYNIRQAMRLITRKASEKVATSAAAR